MYCPKCGTQNSESAKFCRGCGADIGNVLAVVEGRRPVGNGLSEKYVELTSRAVRGILIGMGFLIIAGLSFAIASQPIVFVFFSLAFAFSFLGIGVSRIVQARGIKALAASTNFTDDPMLAAGNTDFIAPPASILESEDLMVAPGSVTERTTRHLDTKK